MHVIEVRPSRPDDGRVSALLRSLDDYLFRTYPAEVWGTECNHILDLPQLLDPAITFLAAWRGEEPLGCGAVRRMRDAHGAYGEVKRMFVQPAARGQRVGERILLALEQAVRQDGIERLYLETGIHQPEAQRLYHRCGWTVCGPFGDYEEHPASVFMEKRL